MIPQVTSLPLIFLHLLPESRKLTRHKTGGLVHTSLSVAPPGAGHLFVDWFNKHSLVFWMIL